MDFDNTIYEPYNEIYHTTTLKKGKYCQFCKGTQASASESQERHNFNETVDAQIGNNRFYVAETCEECGYETSEYVTAKSVVASYYGTADGKAHTVTISDLSDSGVHTSIRYGKSAGNCNQTSAPNYTEAGYYPVYYEIDYEYDNENMVENGVSYVWLLEENAGGSMMLDWGVHLIDQIMYMHDSKVTEIYCKMYSINYPDVDDNFRLTMTLENELTAHIEVSTNNFISHPRWYVLGTDGTLTIDGWEAEGRVVRCKAREDSWGAEIKKNKVGTSKTMAPRSEDSVEEIKINAPTDVVDNLNPVYWQLIDALDGKAPLTITPQQAMRVMKVMEAHLNHMRQSRLS